MKSGERLNSASLSLVVYVSAFDTGSQYGFDCQQFLLTLHSCCNLIQRVAITFTVPQKLLCAESGSNILGRWAP